MSEKVQQSTSKVGVVIPSRGLIFSKTAEEIVNMVKNIHHKFYFSHKKPIPTCFESPVNRALLDWDNTHILIVEDDMIIPSDALEQALALDKDVVVCDYPITKNGRGAVCRDALGKIIYCGTGFMLVKREVFDKLKAPYFRSDIAWNVTRKNKQLRFSGYQRKQNDTYGMQDITFCMKLHQAGVEITALDIILGQRKLIALGKAGSNDGAHQIEEWTTVKKDYSLKQYLSTPDSITSKSKLVQLDTPDGTLLVVKKHANKIANKQDIIKSDTKTTLFDFSSVKI